MSNSPGFGPRIPEAVPVAFFSVPGDLPDQAPDDADLPAPDLDPEEGATLDLSHARTQVRVTGSRARECLNRLIPLDLRSESFPVNSTAATAMHQVGVTLWRSRDG